MIKLDKKFPLDHLKRNFGKNFETEHDCSIEKDSPGSENWITEEENAIKVYLRDSAIRLAEAKLQSEKKSELSSLIELCFHFKVPQDMKNKV